MDNLLVAENITKSYGIRNLFEEVSFGIHEGDHIGLIGINGTGKSTLLRMIAGVEETDSGKITMGKGLRIAYLPQHPEFDTKLSILENVCRNQVSEDSFRNLEGEAAAMLRRLGIEDVNAKTDTLSGGQRKRVALVRTLLTPSDILILDEPTNHLDSEMTEWLEDTLRKYQGAYVMITHDRYFLDEVTNKIWELDKGSLYTYQTNYSGYVEMRAERETMAAATEAKNKNLYKIELAWMLRGARARSTKQKAHIQRFEALRDRPDLELDGEVNISSAYSRLGKKTVEVNHISKAYGDKLLFKDFDLILLQNSRLGIIGPNGCGKSTLVKILTDQLKPDSGTVEYGITVKFGVFSQENEALDETRRVIDYVRDTAEFIKTRDGVITASQMCENFLFTGDMQYSVIGKLSGGEKRRLYLLKILMSAPNILVLDEPTNDLDIKTLTILENYLLQFEGIVIAVSHDRYFLDKIATGLLVFRPDGTIEKQEGNYTDFRERELESSLSDTAHVGSATATGKATSKMAISGTAATGKASIDTSEEGNSFSATMDAAPYAAPTGKVKIHDNKPKFTYKEQKEYETIDQDISTLEEKIADLDQKIAEAANQYSRLMELTNEKTDLEQQLEEKMDRWVYLQELAEQMNLK